MIWTDAGESDKCPQRVAVPWMCHLPYLNSFPWSPPMSWLLHLAAGLLCLASLHITQATVVSNRHAHLDCNGYFYTHTYAHTHTRAHFKRTHIARQTFHTNKRALWTWRHTASSSAGKSIWTSSRPSAPPWPRLKPTLSTCCQMPLSKSKGGGGELWEGNWQDRVFLWMLWWW